MNYYIYAPTYDENSGGSVVLHRLCHLINQIDGCNAYLVPFCPERKPLNTLSVIFIDILKIIKWLMVLPFEKYLFKAHPSWDTPVKTKFEIKDIQDSIVIYPEITYGNPLNASNVVRWFLHQPGHFTKHVCIGVNEFHVKFNNAIKDFNHCFSHLSERELKVIYYPLEYYNEHGGANKDGCCYLVRKGKDKNKCHPETAIKIDGLSHAQVASLFKKSKRFISYDDYTAYSIFAALCGCESVVVPADGISKEQWYPNPIDRYGIAYGFSNEELALAHDSRDKVLTHILNEHQRSFDNVKIFVEDTTTFFYSSKRN